MAIPLIGSLSDLNQSAGMAISSQKYLGDTLLNLGKTIGDSISDRQMYDDANKAAPFMQHSFLDAFNDIAGGNISGGMGKAIASVGQFSSNPILARQAQEGMRAAGIMVNAQMEKFKEEQSTARTNIIADAADRRTEARYDAATQKQLSVVQKKYDDAMAIANNPNMPTEARQLNAAAAAKHKAEMDAISASVQGAPFRQGDYAGDLPTGQAPAKGQVPEPLEAGNIDLSKRQPVDAGDGNVATIRSIGIQDEDGKQVLIPTVVGGKIVSNEEAIANYKKTGEHLGKFNTVEESNAYAQALHEKEAQRVGAGQASYALLGDTQSKLAMGGNLIVTDKNGTGMEMSGMTVKDGSATLSFKTKDGEKLFDIGKDGADAVNKIVGGATKINSDINSFLNTNGGLISMSAMDFTGDKENGYSMRVKVPIKGKDGKTVIVDRDYVQYDENGKAKPVPISQGDKDELDKMEEASATLKQTLNKKGVTLTSQRGQATPEDVRTAALQDAANRPFPFKGDIGATLKDLGSDPEKMKPADIALFNANAGYLLDKMDKNKDFVDSKGVEIPVDQQAKKFSDALTKDAPNWKDSEGKPMFSKEIAKTTDILDASKILSPDIAAGIAKEGPLTRAAKAVGGVIGKAATAVSNAMSEAKIDDQYAELRGRLQQGERDGTITKAQLQKGLTEIQKKRDEAITEFRKKSK